MFWIRSGLHSISISDWLTAGPAVVADAGADLEDARQSMLDALGEAGQRKHPMLALRIRKAQDARALWALRTDLMTAACRMHGEAEGQRRLARVTANFDGLLPRMAAPRKRRLSAAGAVG